MRIDIQRLRALAVMLVIAFHLLPTAVPGGFIGVDVFFVISGYLITSHLVRGAEQHGKVKLLDFLARRVRRLIPGAMVVLVASTICVVIFFPRSLLQQQLTEIGFASVYIVNWNLALNAVDYLASANVASIAQHYWSLSVEEQFYFVWPLLVVLCVWFAAHSRVLTPRKMVLLVLVGIFIVSFLYSIYETARSQPAAYFMTTTRAWEFAAGGIVGLIPFASFLRNSTILILRIGGWLLIGVSAFVITRDTSFPGWIAILPVAGTAMLLWAGTKEPRLQSVDASRFRPVQFIGDISYELYLWHWPLIVLFTTLLGKSPSWKWSVVLVSASIGLAWLTKKYIDEPIRHARWRIKSPLVTFASLAAATAVVVAFALVPATILDVESRADLATAQAAIEEQVECFGAQAIVNSCADPYKVTETVDPVSAKNDNMYSNGVTLTSECLIDRNHSPELFECVLNSPESPSRRIVLLGDSHAYVLATALKPVAETNNWSSDLWSAMACKPYQDRASPACVEWATERLEKVIADSTIDTVILSFSTPLGSDMADRWLSQLVQSGKTVMVFRSVPGAGGPYALDDPRRSAPDCVELSGITDDPCSWPGATSSLPIFPAGVEEIDPRDILCADENCHSVIGGTIVYFDSHHMTTTFTRTLTPWLGESILEIYSRG